MSSQDHITLHSLDTWRRVKRERPDLYWTDPQLWERERRNGFAILAYVERGDDRGALLEASVPGTYYMLTPYGTRTSLNSRKVAVALAEINANSNS